MSTVAIADWSTGEPGIAYQLCESCRHTWYFERSFCPNCGDKRPSRLQASGHARVYAATTVTRAPSPELAELGPYAIMLLDAEEGFRMMAHGDSSLQVGDMARVTFRQFGGRLTPYFIAPNARD
ncbi:MAG: Zn-ribbon domain-containing OB-fold protein [Pseudomonadales bacterium]